MSKRRKKRPDDEQGPEYGPPIPPDMLPKQPPLRWNGLLSVNSDCGKGAEHLVNNAELVIDDGRIVYRAKGVKSDNEDGLETTDPRIIKWEQKKDDLHRRTTDPPIIPFTKADQVRSTKSMGNTKRDPDEPVTCPCCEGKWPDCVLCDGDGRVSDRTAKAYRSAS